VSDQVSYDDGLDRSNPIATHYPLVRRLQRSVARRRGLSRDDADELMSLVHLKLVEDDGSVFRKFEGRSSLSTYLTKVIWRVSLDQQTAAWGKWRPSAQARRQGPTAIRLERLLHRDGLPFDEACALLRAGRITETRAALEQMRDTFPSRQRVRVHGQDLLEALPASALAASSPSPCEPEDQAHDALRRKLGRALVSLSSNDRQLLRLRYRDGMTIARVASELRLDRKRMYREFERVHRTLRAMLTDEPSGRVTEECGRRCLRSPRRP
jgi:RNA polymerase sigma factor (sigma-70 family)